MKRSSTPTLLILTLFSLLITVLSPFYALDAVNDAVKQQILWDIRIPRVLFAFVIGAGLSVCGMVFQAMFHNPLATPFTLGVASGASLGAALCVSLGLSFSLLGISSVTLSAFIGALAAISFVYSLSQFRYGFSSETLLLTGVATNFFFSSLILFTQYLSNANDNFQIMRWLMGNLATNGYDALLQLLPIVIVACAVIIWLSRELNLLMTGDDLAMSRGVAVKQIRYLLFLVTSLCVGAIVSVAGPIGFVGMMVPHICRLLIGNDHRWLTPASLIFGGGFLVLCDSIARHIISPAELPVGVITTLLGGPFFLWLLVKSRQNAA